MTLSSANSQGKFDVASPTHVESIERLVRENRQLKVAVVLVLVGLTVLLSAGGNFGAARRVVEADKFIVRDRVGRVRVQIALTKDDRPSIEFFSEDEKRRISLAENDDGDPVFAFFGQDDEKTSRCTIGMVGDDAVGLTFAGRNDQALLALGVKPGDAPELRIMDKRGTVRIALGLKADGTTDIDIPKKNERGK